MKSTFLLCLCLTAVILLEKCSFAEPDALEEPLGYDAEEGRIDDFEKNAEGAVKPIADAQPIRFRRSSRRRSFGGGGGARVRIYPVYYPSGNSSSAIGLSEKPFKLAVKLASIVGTTSVILKILN